MDGVAKQVLTQSSKLDKIWSALPVCLRMERIEIEGQPKENAWVHPSRQKLEHYVSAQARGCLNDGVLYTVYIWSTERVSSLQLEVIRIIYLFSSLFVPLHATAKVSILTSCLVTFRLKINVKVKAKAA